MDIKLKHRLVGACVILALAVFFLPMILDSEKYNQDIKSQIPEESTLDIQPQNDSSNEGTLTINLDEDEPEKAIQTQPEVEKQETSSQQSTSTAANSQKDNNKAEEVSSDDASSKKAPVEVEQQDTVEQSKDTKPEDSEAATESAQSSSEETSSQETETTTPQEKSEESGSDKTVTKTATGTAEKQPEPPKKPQFSEQAWVIQIGSFSNKENATSLVADLRNQGFRAYQREAEAYTRVFVGPYPDEAAANQRTKSLEKIVGAPVKVIEFDPQGH